MKKLLIASAALAMVAGTAQAQSSVTVYGSYDIGYTDVKMENINGKTDTANQLKQQGLNQASGNGPLTSNRLGFRGTEDLGGGLKANFNLEFGFRSDMTGDTVTTGSHSTANANASGQALSQIQTRTSRVGIESASLGRLDVGYGLTGLFATVSGHSPLPGNNWVGDVAYTSDTTSGADSRILAGAVRMNGINYTSPKFGGFTARIDAGTNTNRTDSGEVTDVRSTNNGLTVNYSAGAFALAATVHQNRADTATTAATSNAVTTTDYQAVSARYAVTKDLVVNALYADNKAKVGGVQSSKNDVMQVGVSYAMGKTSLVAQYGTGEGEGANATTAQRDRKGYQVGAIYNLSKRTNAYAIYGSQETKYVNAQTSSGGTNGAAGTVEKLSGYAVGLRHSF
jgi:predicted porin